MSYILDAIKKAENQRRHDQVPSLEAMVTERATRAKKRRVPWKPIALIAMFLVLVSVSWFYQEKITGKFRQTYTFVSKKIVTLGHKTQAFIQNRKEPSGVSAASTAQVSSATANQTQERQKQVKTPSKSKATSTERLPPPPNRITFSVISYAKDSNKRFVMAGAEFVREGETYNSYLIQEITENGVIVEKAGKQYWVRP